MKLTGQDTLHTRATLTAGGKTYEGLRATTSDLEVLLYLDKEHRLDRLEVPSAKVTIIRE